MEAYPQVYLLVRFLSFIEFLTLFINILLTLIYPNYENNHKIYLDAAALSAYHLPSL